MVANASDSQSESDTKSAKKKSGIGGRIAGIIIGGLILLGGAAYLGAHVNTAVHQSAPVTAHVIGSTRLQRCPSDNSSCYEVYPPKVTFTAGSKGTVTSTVSGLEPDSRLPVGRTLQIRYDRSSPTVTHPASVRWWSTWGVPSLIILFGAFIVWACIPPRNRRS